MVFTPNHSNMFHCDMGKNMPSPPNNTHTLKAFHYTTVLSGRDIRTHTRVYHQFAQSFYVCSIANIK